MFLVVTAATAGGLDLGYSLSAFLFNWGWHEGTLGASIVIRHGLIWLILAALAVLLWQIGSVPGPVWIVCGVVTVLFAAYNILETRREIVQGGKPPLTAAKKAERKVIVITGANTGIGLETARQLVGYYPDSLIVLLCRSRAKGEAAARDILENNSQNKNNNCPNIEIVECNLSNFASVRRAAYEIRQRNSSIDILINNAGVMLKNTSRTVDEHEACLQANHLGHFLLTALLLPILRERLLIVSSSTYRLAANKNFTVSTDYLECKSRDYTLFGQYAVTKLCNIMHAIYLKEVVFTAAIHPGLVRTDVVRNMPWFMRVSNDVFGFLLSTLQKTPAQGAWNTVYLATTTATTTAALSTGEEEEEEEAKTGLYWVNRKPQPLLHKMDIEFLAKELWDWSVDQVQLTPQERAALDAALQRDCKKSQ